MTGFVMVTKRGGCGGGSNCGKGAKITKVVDNDEEQNQLSLVDILLAALRKSMVACRVESHDDVISAVHQMEIGWPTHVQHITHVTFDRFNGFLGLPVEFEVEIPGRVPSASASVFGVSADSMQCSFDARGNSVPTILLLMQERLYSQGGLKAEGIFRINPENSKEEHVRDQLNRGSVPEDIDVHCLAGLIKAWFRELPSGVLDGLSPEQVLQCNTEEESVELVKQLKPTEAALLNWAIDLMSDVVEEEEYNKMNARNIAMVFSPNMTQMSDPLTALMHAVQVMNLLKTLIMKTLREREETETTGGYSPMSSHSCRTQSEEEFDSHQEMDTGFELRGVKSDCDDLAHYNGQSPEDKEHVESTNEIKECFLSQLDNCSDPRRNFSEESAGHMQVANANPRGDWFKLDMDCNALFTSREIENSYSTTTDSENSRTILPARRSKVDAESLPATECPNAIDFDVMDKLKESVSPVSFLSSI